MTHFNPKTLNISEIVKHHCNIESEIECQLYSDPEEKNHLDFTEIPTPSYKAPERVKLSVGVFNLVRQMLP